MALGMMHKALIPVSVLCLLATAAGSAIWASNAVAGRSTGHTPKRIVSVNLCADQLLLMLAERERIASVTEAARASACASRAAP